MFRDFRSLWARGSDGAPARVWVIRSAVFALVCSAWSLWGDHLTRSLPSTTVTDFLLRRSTVILLAVYLAWAARSGARAVTAVIVLIASTIGSEVYGSTSGQWMFAAMNEPGYEGPNTAQHVASMVGMSLTFVPYWATWGIARRRTSWWALTVPVPLLGAVAAPLLMETYMNTVDEFGEGDVSALWLIAATPVVVSILAAWAVDVIAWRRAGSPDWSERISDTPRPPDPLFG